MQTLFTAQGSNMNLLDPQDLAANRTGRLSDAQIQRLAMHIEWNQGCVALIFLPISIFLTIMALGGLLGGEMRPAALIVSACFGGVALFFFVLAAAGLWNMVRKWQTVNRDRQNNAIRQAQGQLAFDKHGYCFETGERRLSLPSAENTGGLLPGATYRVFYLEESGVLLSAEEIFPASPAQTRAALLKILAQANHFTLDDLAHNRNGEISPSQRMKPLGQVMFGTTFMLPFLILSAIFVFQVFLSEQTVSEALSVLFIPLLIWGFFLLFSGLSIVNGLLDILFPSLKQTQGPGRKEKQTGRSTRYYYVIGGNHFKVSRLAYIALPEKIEYRVYYLPRTHKLVSIEPVEVAPEWTQSNF